MRWTMRQCYEAMRWTMRRCDEAMRWGYVTIAPSHRLIVHRIASSSIASPHRPSHRLIASPHRPSHRLIVHRIASSSIALDIIRNASVSLLGHHRCRWQFHAVVPRPVVSASRRRSPISEIVPNEPSLPGHTWGQFV